MEKLPCLLCYCLCAQDLENILCRLRCLLSALSKGWTIINNWTPSRLRKVGRILRVLFGTDLRHLQVGLTLKKWIFLRSRESKRQNGSKQFYNDHADLGSDGHYSLVLLPPISDFIHQAQEDCLGGGLRLFQYTRKNHKKWGQKKPASCVWNHTESEITESHVW